ncbi:uncharacterized protein FOKN1_1380 [Thiohalobacter thiocyanaticus]|uniref:Uncharacterized protein n=1 Tax=Thiohalobacter thiocyanaticus TaxID=585455 RepID=A0A1Z4VR15_9GAMM|nr:hypothetical protein [Thiohalobacter thiocyanaticus]BAZ93778.1 uncharacterized protein FOKN1_1380 [Thiohalobacter thiocyanaticus]
MKDSWDQDSQAEYEAWIHSSATTTSHKRACARLWSILKLDILVNGPVELTQCQSVQRRDGKTVQVHCVTRTAVAMCFAVCEDEVHLVVIGPYNDSRLWSVAKQRAQAW